jgi:hypothetical protein
MFHVGMPKKPGIYLINCAGRRYIGQSVNIYVRLRRHAGQLKCNKHVNQFMQNIWNKHGQDAFQADVLEICLPYEQLSSLERKYIQEVNPELNVKREIVGANPVFHSQQKKPVIDNLGRIYPSMNAAARAFGVGIAEISAVLNGTQTQTGGCSLALYTEESPTAPAAPVKKDRRIKDQHGNIYLSPADAAKTLNLSVIEISKVLKGDYNFVKGWSFKWLGDSTPFGEAGVSKRRIKDQHGNIYPSTIEACKAAGTTDRRKFYKCLKGRIPLNGTVYYYLDD